MGLIQLDRDVSGLADFEAELFAFPGGRFDDQVDAVSQALNHRNEQVDLRSFANGVPWLGR